MTGDGIGGTEKKLGAAATREECIAMVKTHEPTANGATFSGAALLCFAEFGMTGSNSNPLYQTCLFGNYFLSFSTWYYFGFKQFNYSTFVMS